MNNRESHGRISSDTREEPFFEKPDFLEDVRIGVYGSALGLSFKQCMERKDQLRILVNRERKNYELRQLDSDDEEYAVAISKPLDEPKVEDRIPYEDLSPLSQMIRERIVATEVSVKKAQPVRKNHSENHVDPKKRKRINEPESTKEIKKPDSVRKQPIRTCRLKYDTKGGGLNANQDLATRFSDAGMFGLKG